MEEQKSSNKMIIGIAVVLLIAAATAGVVIWTNRSTNQQTVSDDTNKTVEPSTSATGNSANTSSYKNGTYTAEGTYMTPGGQEAIDVKITLVGGIINDIEVTQKPISKEAHTYQAAFVSGYKSQVVGKSIDEVSLSRVSGSSLTPNGFNNALQTIRSDARA